tara:strand:- start:120 stop:1055 length:936 start_codon:yes stop_codon:yes gene_type:complete
MIDVSSNILTLLSIDGFGLVNSYKLLSSLENIRSDNIIEALNRKNDFSISSSEWFSKKEKFLEKLNKSLDQNISVIPFTSSDYPKSLKELNDFPLVIFVKGKVESLNVQNTLAIVGTRNPTKYTYDYAPEICNIFASKSQSVISGLAIGCDTIAHKSAIKMGIPTVAVLPNGLDQIYPKENSYLASEIIDYGGCLVSEYLIGTKPSRYQFVARDRIQAGLSKVGLLLESSSKGGSMYCIRKLDKLRRKISYLSPQNESKYNECWSGNKSLSSSDKFTEIIPFSSKEEINSQINNLFFNTHNKKDFEQTSLF